MWHLITLSDIHTRDRPVAEISENTQHSQETDIHGPNGIRTRIPSKPEAVDPLLTPCGPGIVFITVKSAMSQGLLQRPKQMVVRRGLMGQTFPTTQLQQLKCSTCAAFGLSFRAERSHFLWTASRIRRSMRSRWLLCPQARIQHA
jgi:hypothetical protein